MGNSQSAGLLVIAEANIANTCSLHLSQMSFRKSFKIQPGGSRCPTCGEMFDPLITPVMPFCSERCQQIDLGRWFDEEIGLPVEPENEFNEEHASDD